ncbi:MAG: 30S ribosome-binding factor RbfA [Acidimicrobiia bacterium]
MSRRSHRPAGTAREFPRTARLNHLIHEIVADALERLDDERLGFLTVVAVEVDPDLRRATVWYTSLAGDEADHDVVDALAQHRSRIQRAIGRQARLKRTPELVFRPDTVTRQAERVEGILRDLSPRPAEDG